MRTKLFDWDDMIQYVVLKVEDPAVEIIGHPQLVERRGGLECVGFRIQRVVRLDSCGYALCVVPWVSMHVRERDKWDDLVYSLLEANQDVMEDWCRAQIGKVA